MLLSILTLFSFLIWIAAISITAFGTVAALLHLRKGPRLRDALVAESEYEPITILKPLKGVDEGIEENLESFLLLDYPNYEVLFSVADEDDPVIPIVQKLRARHPRIHTELYIGAVDYGPNPKINNLLRTYDNARHDWILISDSNTRMSAGHLKTLACQFRKGIAMQTSVVAGVDAEGLGGHLESVFLNTFYARSIMTLRAVGHPCVMGKAMMFRKSILERIGGLRSLKKHIAEDYAAGRKLHLLGFRVQVSRNPIRQHLGRHSLKAFWSRHVRWGRLRKMQAPAAFVIEPLFNSMLAGVLGAYAFSTVYGIPPVTFFAAHMAIWFLCDFILAMRVGDTPGIVFAPVWLLRELVHFPLWVHISLGNTVCWRGQTIRLKKVKFVEAQFYAIQDLEAFFRRPDLTLPEIDDDFEEVA